MNDLYALVCDAIARTLYDDIDPNDGLLHTSKQARSLALQIFEIVGLEV